MGSLLRRKHPSHGNKVLGGNDGKGHNETTPVVKTGVVSLCPFPSFPPSTLFPCEGCFPRTQGCFCIRGCSACWCHGSGALPRRREPIHHLPALHQAPSA